MFKVDHNPIQWPPRDVLGPLISVDPAPSEGQEKSSHASRSEEDLKPWIEGMRRWLKAEIAKHMASAEAEANAEASAERVIEAADEALQEEDAIEQQSTAEDESTPVNGAFLSSAE